MRYLWKIIRNIMVVIGGFLVYGGISTSDYYTLELGQAEPTYVWVTIFIGIFLMIPALIHIICEG